MTTSPDNSATNGKLSSSPTRFSWSREDPVTRHNLLRESLFSAFNGIYMALAILAAPVIAVVGVGVSPLELTILVSAFPVGAFLGPFWASLGRRWGMHQLVTRTALFANLPLFLIFWVDNSIIFTALITLSQLLNSAMRMGQSSLYSVLYARHLRGRVLGRLTFWTYLTMVPSILISGWLLNESREMYQVIYPVAGLCGLIGCWFYHRLRVPVIPPPPRISFGARLREVERVLSKDGAYRYFQIAFFLSGSAFFMSTHVILLLVTDRFAFDAFELSLWMSVVPQLLLAVGSPLWGRILDRVGIVYCRLLIGIIMTVYLASYFAGIMTGVAVLIFLGSLLQGTSNAGGQLTWALASSHFAPRQEDVPLYNGIHFFLNGVRGLILPWVGALLFLLIGPWSVLVATLVSLASVPIVLRLMRLERKVEPETLSPSLLLAVPEPVVQQPATSG